MSGPLGLLVLAYAALTALALALVAAGAPLLPAARAGVVVLELLLVVQAVLDVVSLARGHRPVDPGTHAGYLVASVVLLPVLVARRPRSTPAGPVPGSADAGDRPPGRVTQLADAVAVAATAVVSVRLRVTWAAA